MSIITKAMIPILTLMAFQYSAGYAATSEDKAYQHLSYVMDKYHGTFDVYTDRDAGGNHFFPGGWMPEDVQDGIDMTFDSACTLSPYSGTSCIRITYSGNKQWVGIYWQNPDKNWGTEPKAGYDLTGATEITFHARGEEGGEEIEFFAFGIGRDPSTGLPIEPYPDSATRTPPPGNRMFLSREWQQYTIDITGQNLNYVIGGFGFAADRYYNPNGAVFYLDDIKYNLPRDDEPRFLRSYETIQLDEPDFALTNAAYIYDNAIAALAYVARGTDDDLRRARLILDAFVYAQGNDPEYKDDRLRSAYRAGDLSYKTDMDETNKAGTIRLPGWWNDEKEEWSEDTYQISTNTGNMAWVMIALLRYYQDVEPNESYLTTAERLGEWIAANTHDLVGVGGYTTGYERGDDGEDIPLTGKSTEHNIDLVSAFLNLYFVTSDPMWLERAQHALRFLEAMWDNEAGRFWIGTEPDGQTIWDVPEIQPMDTNTWGFMVLSIPEVYGRGIKWVEDYCSSTCSGFEGFDYNYDNDRSAVWFEGSAQMVLAYQLLGEEAKAEHYLNEIRRVQVEGPNNNGKGIISACPDGLDTYLDWLFYSRLHVGATSWYLFAECRYNPLRVDAGDFQAIYLKSGWNLISFFLQPLDPDPAAVLYPINEKCGPMWAYDPNTGWSMHPSEAYNALQEVRPCSGYWLNITQPCILNVVGTTPGTTAISLRANEWNLVGYCCREARNVDECIHAIENSVDLVWGYSPDTGWSPYLPGVIEILQAMKPGGGYWMRANQDCVWNVGATCITTALTTAGRFWRQ